MNNIEPTYIWAGLTIILSLACYALGYSRRAIVEDERKRRMQGSYLERL